MVPAENSKFSRDKIVISTPVDGLHTLGTGQINLGHFRSQCLPINKNSELIPIKPGAAVRGSLLAIGPNSASKLCTFWVLLLKYSVKYVFFQISFRKSGSSLTVALHRILKWANNQSVLLGNKHQNQEYGNAQFWHKDHKSPCKGSLNL